MCIAACWRRSRVRGTRALRAEIVPHPEQAPGQLGARRAGRIRKRVSQTCAPLSAPPARTTSPAAQTDGGHFRGTVLRPGLEDRGGVVRSEG